MNLTILVVILFVSATLVPSKGFSTTRAIPLQNPGFETRPTNITDATSQFVLLDNKINDIPGWSFNGTLWYVTAGGNISLPGNGYGLQLGPNGMINQTFKSDGSYDYVLTFTLASSSIDCANNNTAVNVSGPGLSKVFFFKESLGNETWQTYAFSIGSNKIRNDLMGIQIQSVVSSSPSNIICWPIVDTLLVTGIQFLFNLSDNVLWNGEFEMGPTFVDNSSQGILLEAHSRDDLFYPIRPSYSPGQTPILEWNILGIVKYIDSKHYAVPQGRGAVELVSGNPSNPSGMVYSIQFSKKGQVTLDFIMGDANDSCVGDLTVFLQVGNYYIWNFTMRSIGVGSRETHSVTFKAEFSETEEVQITFSSINETRTSNHQVLCGPVIDNTVLRFSSGLHSKQLNSGWFLNKFGFTNLTLIYTLIIYAVVILV